MKSNKIKENENFKLIRKKTAGLLEAGLEEGVLTSKYKE